MSRLTAGIRTLALVTILSIAWSSAAADVPELSVDGWHTWRIAANENAPDWCCFRWNSGRSLRKSCDLSRDRNGYSISGEQAGDVEDMQIYAFTDAGRVTRIRTYSAQCHVRTTTEITDLGLVTAEASVEWLKQFIEPQSKLSSHAMAAISTHQGDRPIVVLMDVVRGNSTMDHRRDALFWLVNSDSDQAFQFLDRLLSDNQVR